MISKTIPSTFILSFFIFIYNYIVHNVCLASMYEQTPQLWRTSLEMSDKLCFMMISQFLYALFFTLFYQYLYEKTNNRLNGITFGSFMGGLLSVGQIGMYAYLPISFQLVMYWVSSTFIESFLCGLILSQVINCSWCFRLKNDE